MKILTFVITAFFTLIAINGSVSAGPPELGPVAVETLPGNPLEVTVVGAAAPAVKILAQGSTSCTVSFGSCFTPLRLDFPEGTDIFVFQQLSVKMENHNDADVAYNSYEIFVPATDSATILLNSFHIFGSVAKRGGGRNGEPNYSDNSIVNFIVPNDSDGAPELRFFPGPPIHQDPGGARQTMYWSGYYTKR